MWTKQKTFQNVDQPSVNVAKIVYMPSVSTCVYTGTHIRALPFFTGEEFQSFVPNAGRFLLFLSHLYRYKKLKK